MMEDKVTVESLPYEVLERILSNDCIRIEDVVSCALTCKYLSGVCCRNSLWKAKLTQHYPYSYEYLVSHHEEKRDWKVKYVGLYKCKKKLVQSILALSRTFVWSMYHDYEWPDIPRRALALYDSLFTEELGEANDQFIVDECRNILNLGPACMDLTLKYYADKLLRHTYEKLVINRKWEDFKKQPVSVLKYSYEEGLLWVVVALRPIPLLFSAPAINNTLDDLALETLAHIKEKYPDNPVCNKIRSKSDFIKEGPSSWSGEHCSEILQAVHYILKHKHNFKIKHNLCDSEPDHYCVDQVLVSKKGSSKIILVVVACLARRLGVFTELHKDLRDFVLATWKVFARGQDGVNYYLKDCDMCKEEQTSMNVLIDDWNSEDGQMVDAPGMCRSILQQVVMLTEFWLKGEKMDQWQAGEPILYDLLDEETYNQPIRILFTAWQHVEHWKMSRLYHYMNQLLKASDNLTQVEGRILHLSILLRINSKLTLEKLLQFRRRMGQPPNTMRDLLRMLASVDKRARTRVTELKNLLSSSITSYSSLNPLASVPWPHGWPGGEMVQKRRVDRKSWQVQFAVGEVLEQRGGYLCVVYDWDSMCVESEDTLVLMGETGLSYGTDQPFYRVLTDGGSARYLAQENLRHARQPKHIKNPLIGRYFTAFIFPFYLPNPQKAYEYPEDANIREQNALSLKLKLPARS